MTRHDDDTLIAGPPYQYDPRLQAVNGVSAKTGQVTKICDVRGWGYLTGGGHCALGLDHETAKRIQDRTGETIAQALNDAMLAERSKHHE